MRQRRYVLTTLPPQLKNRLLAWLSDCSDNAQYVGVRFNVCPPLPLSLQPHRALSILRATGGTGACWLSLVKLEDLRSQPLILGIGEARAVMRAWLKTAGGGRPPHVARTLSRTCSSVETGSAVRRCYQGALRLLHSHLQSWRHWLKSFSCRLCRHCRQPRAGPRGARQEVDVQPLCPAGRRAAFHSGDREGALRAASGLCHCGKRVAL